MRRVMRRTVRGVMAYFRLAGILLLLVVLAAARRMKKRWVCGFLVYGNATQQSYFLPRYGRQILPLVFPIGLMPTKFGWGVLLGTRLSEEELNGADVSRATKLIRAMIRSADILTVNIEAAALAGRLPGFAARAGVPLVRPVVNGLMGTTFTVRGAIDAALLKHGIHPKSARVCIIGGAGHAGQFLVGQIAGRYGQIIVLDPNPERLNGLRTKIQELIAATDSRWIATADVVVNLSGRGDDMKMYAPFLTEGTVIIDDTHPPMSRELRQMVRGRGAILYKVVTTGADLVMIPRLPGFGGKWIPGCLVEALVVAILGWDVLNGTLDEFARLAEDQVGIRIQLETHPDDD